MPLAGDAGDVKVTWIPDGRDDVHAAKRFLSAVRDGKHRLDDRGVLRRTNDDGTRLRRVHQGHVTNIHRVATARDDVRPAGPAKAFPKESIHLDLVFVPQDDDDGSRPVGSGDDKLLHHRVHSIGPSKDDDVSPFQNGRPPPLKVGQPLPDAVRQQTDESARHQHASECSSQHGQQE
jgi:hypothetical protein